ncbi:MAG: hypothetical protein ACYCXY_13770 [Acidimicrobiales bacterium]
MAAEGARDWYDLAAGRRWARANGHFLEGGQIGQPFSMSDGFHRTCEQWSVPQEQVSHVRAISSPGLGYERWAEHVREAAATGPTPAT